VVEEVAGWWRSRDDQGSVSPVRGEERRGEERGECAVLRIRTVLWIYCPVHRGRVGLDPTLSHDMGPLAVYM